ncbi:hypothetical protein EJB05_39393, partial [Eragrostis curvula]
MADGEGEVLPLHSLDYPCTARFRQRRLFAYLRAYGCWEVYQTAKSVMPVLFHTRDLAKKIREGQWRDARYYITRFAPFVEVGNEASLLVLFLRNLMTLNNFADGQAMPPTCLWYWMKSIHKKPVLDKYPCFAALADDVLSNRNDHARAFLDWQLIRNKAAKVAEEMAYKVPELRERMCYPRCRTDLYHIMPVGLGSRASGSEEMSEPESESPPPAALTAAVPTSPAATPATATSTLTPSSPAPSHSTVPAAAPTATTPQPLHPPQKLPVSPIDAADLSPEKLDWGSIDEEDGAYAIASIRQTPPAAKTAQAIDGGL